MKNYQEKLDGNQKHGVEAQKPATEYAEKLTDNSEINVELSPQDIEARNERIRLEAIETAKSIESKSNKKAEERPSTSRRGPIGKKQREKSFVQTMNQVQSTLPASGRIFSRIIHNEFVEKTSDVLGNTVARPDAILAGAFAAFILTLLTYTVAKTIGYSLSGFETIAAFIIGWLIGITYDYLRVLFTGKKS